MRLIEFRNSQIFSSFCEIKKASWNQSASTMLAVSFHDACCEISSYFASEMENRFMRVEDTHNKCLMNFSFDSHSKSSFVKAFLVFRILSATAISLPTSYHARLRCECQNSLNGLSFSYISDALRVDSCPLLEEGGCQSNHKLGSVSRPEQVPPWIDDQVGLLAGSTDVIELLIHILNASDILQDPPPLTLLQKIGREHQGCC